MKRRAIHGIAIVALTIFIIICIIIARIAWSMLKLMAVTFWLAAKILAIFLVFLLFVIAIIMS